MKKLTIWLIVSLLFTMCLAVPSFGEEYGDDNTECTHTWTEWETFREPSCGTEGLEELVCQDCYETIRERIIPATNEHDWSEWEVIKAATVKKAGKKTRYCTECLADQYEAIKKLKPFARFGKKSYSLAKKRTINLKSEIEIANGDRIKKWKTSNKKIASINKNGKLKAKKKGTVTVTAFTKSGKKAKCKVKVTAAKKSSKAVYATSVKKPSGKVYWTPYGKVYHATKNCPTLSKSRVIKSGSLKACPKPRGCYVCY